MKYTIEKIPSHQIAFIRNVGPYGTDNAASMKRLREWAKSNNLLNEESILYGIAHDNPDEINPNMCRYDVCIAINNTFESSDKIKVTALQGGNYAVFLIPHTAAEIQSAWKNIFPILATQLDSSRPILERYKSKLIMQHLCEICVPVNAES